LPGTETRVGGLADPQNSVETLLDHIHQPVIEIQLQADAGISRHELGEQRQRYVPDQRQADPQHPRGCLGLLDQLVTGGVTLIQDAPAPDQEALSLGGEGDAAGAAVEQPHAQCLFQPRHGLAGGRGGDAEHAAGLDEAAGVGDLHEGLQVAEVVQG